MRNRYNVALAIAGFSVTFLFMLAAACMIYGSAALLLAGGFWPTVGGVAMMLPIIWSMYLGAGVAYRTIVAQR